MGFLIDTSVFIDIERGRISLDDFLKGFTGQELFIATISASELLVGAHRSNTEPRRLQRLGFVERIFERIATIPFDLRSARMHATLWIELTESGQRLGANDLLIASTALAYGHGVVTSDVKAFNRVPGLLVQSPGW
jgi:predicted nucleic acid-binding protein